MSYNKMDYKLFRELLGLERTCFFAYIKKKELTIMVSSFVLISGVGQIQQLVICEHLLVVQVLHDMHI